jgi:IS4 transposase
LPSIRRFNHSLAIGFSARRYALTWPMKIAFFWLQLHLQKDLQSMAMALAIKVDARLIAICKK